MMDIAETTRLAYRHRGDKDTEPIAFEVVVDLADEGGKTRLTMRMRFPSNDERDFVIDKYGAFEGLKECKERLRDHVAMQDAFVISRTFDAPLALVWKAHTEIGHLEKWWGPRGFAMVKATLDLRPGGMFHYGMRTPGGQEMWGRSLRGAPVNATASGRRAFKDGCKSMEGCFKGTLDQLEEYLAYAR